MHTFAHNVNWELCEMTGDDQIIFHDYLAIFLSVISDYSLNFCGKSYEGFKVEIGSVLRQI